jgi:oxygen-independent coproporphyrinogen-3 oxidase
MAGIYIHIPFCKKICSYCDFYHVTSVTDYQPFVDAIIKEAAIRKEYVGNELISTIYFGGGTPSALSVDETGTLLRNLQLIFRIDPGCEITVELNPDDVSPDYLHGLKDLNINRISLGIQSWRNQDLKLLNRRHNAAQAAKALEETFNAGFHNVTIDLIYGIPGMTTKEWSSNLDISFSYDIKHLSAYHLTIETGTILNKMKEKGIIAEIDEEESSAQFNLLIEKAAAAGFIHYEISNFRQAGIFFDPQYQLRKQVNYLGLGPSAHSFNGYSRNGISGILRNT